MSETTHEVDPETKKYVQVVTARRLREVLRASGDTLTRPSWFGPEDEWDVESSD